jgi:hypothetical protein
MLKAKAIELLGGTVASAAKEIGVSYQAVDKWPDELPARIADRVMAALARKLFPDLAGETAGISADREPEPKGKPQGWNGIERRKTGWKASA